MPAMNVDINDAYQELAERTGWDIPEKQMERGTVRPWAMGRAGAFQEQIAKSLQDPDSFYGSDADINDQGERAEEVLAVINLTSKLSALDSRVEEGRLSVDIDEVKP